MKPDHRPPKSQTPSIAFPTEDCKELSGVALKSQRRALSDSMLLLSDWGRPSSVPQERNEGPVSTSRRNAVREHGTQGDDGKAVERRGR